jgi:SPP1 family predicted phage head-tail adaptor
MTIEQRGSTRTPSGAPQETWSTVAIVWAGFQSLSGRELEAAQKIVADATSQISLRYLPGVIPEMRINWFDRPAKATRHFDILAVTDEMERHRSLVLLCREHNILPGQ